MTLHGQCAHDDDDLWTFTECMTTPEEMAELQRLLALDVKEGPSIQWENDA